MKQVRLALRLMSMIAVLMSGAPSADATIKNNEVVITGKVLYAMCTNTDAEIEPVPTSGGGRKPEPEMDKLSNIVKAFNDQYAKGYADPERTLRRIDTIEIAIIGGEVDLAFPRRGRIADRPVGVEAPQFLAGLGVVGGDGIEAG